MPRELEIIRIPEPIAYAPMMAQLRARRDAVETGNASNALFLLVHRPVITLGRNGHREHVLLTPEALAAQGIDLVETDRGGDVTYHGPGQLVAYPVLDLNQWQCSVGWYLRALEEVLIRLLAEYGLSGERVSGFTGVWVNGAKVAAIGVSVHRWVTAHGIALNVHPNMEHFGMIIPCGIADKPVTSLSALLGSTPEMDDVIDRFEACFRERFLG